VATVATNHTIFFDPWPMAKSLKMCVTDLKSV
jgi:hypothetical protein